VIASAAVAVADAAVGYYTPTVYTAATTGDRTIDDVEW
jgi:hypothetical protein